LAAAIEKRGAAIESILELRGLRLSLTGRRWRRRHPSGLDNHSKIRIREFLRAEVHSPYRSAGKIKIDGAMVPCIAGD
jgi:hypothetical protein